MSEGSDSEETDAIEPRDPGRISKLNELLESLKWSPFCFFIMILQSVQWAISGQMFVMTAYLTPAGDTIAPNGTYKSVRDEWPDEPPIFGFMDSYEMISSIAFVGNLIFGTIPNLLSDRYGRRKLLVFILFFIVIADTACALSPTFWFLIVGRFMQGCFMNAIASLNFVHCMESIAEGSRFLASCAFGLFWTIGYCLVAPEALVVGTWRWIFGINAIAALVCALVQLLLVPESPYYCVSQGDRNKLEAFVKRSEWINRQTYDVDYEAIMSRKGPDGEEHVPTVVTVGESLSFLFKNPPVLLLLFVMGYAEIATMLSYAGISLAATTLDVGDANWNFVLSGLVEFPAYCVAPKFLDWFPSKFVMIVVFACASGSLVALKFIPHDLTALYIAFWLLSKFFATSCYMTSLIVTSELFPTKCRSFAVGFALTFSNIGSIIAPHLGVLNDIAPDLAFLVFGAALSIATVLVAIFIPRNTKFEA
ncbi:hypothetical protein PRIPAC_77277 [Pristionchus pacificus]|nr:hypothetical protein PRIPAC_77277 [Pristionchus pacificus]